MKKALSILSTFVLLVAFTPSVWAYDGYVTLDGGQTIYYNINYSSNTIEITCPDNYGWGTYPKPTGALVIPDSITRNNGWTDNTYPVTAIGSSAFSGCNELTSITIPEGVTTIGGSAFSSCSGLTSVTIPEGVTTIGSYAFYNCSGLTSVTIPDGVTSIGNQAFLMCSSLTSITIPKSVTSLGWYTFEGCNLTSVVFNADSCTYADSPFAAGNNITSFTIGDNVKCIPAKLCYGGCYMTTITIPDSINYIGDEAFRGCSSLTSVTIGNGVTSIGNDAFLNCSNLTSVIFNADSCISAGSYNNPVFAGCSSLTNITFGNNIKRIPSYLYYGLYSLTSVTIPNSVTSIGTAAFGNCYPTTVTIGNNTLTVAPNDSTMEGFIWIYIPSTNSWNHTIYAYADLEELGCYYFAGWSDGCTTERDTILLTSDLNLTAIFERNTYHLTAGANDATLGSVALPLGDSALCRDTLMAVATPIEHYHVASWQGWNIVATSAEKDTVWVRMDGNTTIICTFAIDTHTVSVAPSDILRGSVSTTGTEFVYGTPCTVEATAYTGYTFHSWSNGVTANPYTFAVTEDLELTAIFLAPGEETYTVSVNVNDLTMGTATVNGSTTTTVMSGTEVTLTATANQGYRFVRWNDDNTEATRTVTVTSDMSFTAYFESIEGIDEADGQAVVIYAADGSIHIDATQPAEAAIYDMMGRHLATVATGTRTPMPTGAYMVKVGTLPAKKVVVVK